MPDSAPELLPLPIRPAPAPPPGWLRRVLLNPLLGLLKAGLSPNQLALTVALGAALGIGPLLGLTTILSTLLALRLRLNVAAMQLVVHLLTPVQVVLLLPLLRFGARLLGQGTAVDGLTVSSLRTQLAHNPGQVLRLLWRAEAGALLLWGAAAVPLVAGLYFGLRPVFWRAARRVAE